MGFNRAVQQWNLNSLPFHTLRCFLRSKVVEAGLVTDVHGLNQLW
jgi:hypothetical protein